jgi:phenylacetyl-CoA:acceptor oxidoreductase subunit 1
MTRWGMVIDLRKCIGCETCKHVCYDVNFVPPGSTWRQVVAAALNGCPEGQQVFITMGCMHCNEPPCLEVCPTSATKRRTDGIVTIDPDLCVGCGACILACPYDARKITFEDKIAPEKGQRDENFARPKSDQIGVCSKCDFCLPRVDEGQGKGLLPGRDPEATPMCVRFCIAEALYFGDLDDPESEVSRLILKNKTRRLNEGLQTEPSVFYILD